MTRIALLVLGLSTFAAQTPPPPTLQWNAPSNTADAVEAQSLIYTLYVNGGTGIVVTGVTCTGVVPSNCSAPPAGRDSDRYRDAAGDNRENRHDIGEPAQPPFYFTAECTDQPPAAVGSFGTLQLYVVVRVCQ